jgi:glycosyltransferase involved in cell wall biosynthesis
VVPSLWFEGPPSVILEAFAHGRPVVATAVGAQAAAVPATTGWLAEPDPAALGTALGRARRCDVRRAGAARAEYLGRYTAVRARDALLGHYRACLPR